MAALRESLRELIQRQFTGTEQLVHFRKLESAASEDDLRSLFEDLERLRSLTDEGNDKPRK